MQNKAAMFDVCLQTIWTEWVSLQILSAVLLTAWAFLQMQNALLGWKWLIKLDNGEFFSYQPLKTFLVSIVCCEVTVIMYHQTKSAHNFTFVKCCIRVCFFLINFPLRGFSSIIYWCTTRDHLCIWCQSVFLVTEESVSVSRWMEWEHSEESRNFLTHKNVFLLGSYQNK